MASTQVELMLLDLSSESDDSDYVQDEINAMVFVKKNRKTWMSEYLKQRKEFGEFHKLINKLDDVRFKNYFRVSREQFGELHEWIAADIRKQDTNFRKSIRTKEQLAICLRYLATGNTYTSLAYNFRVSPRTVARCVRDVCIALWLRLQSQFMPDPTSEDLLKTAAEFKSKWNFDHCIGAIDGKHVTIKAPPNSGSSFFNYKKTFSIVLMALVDANYKFLAIDIGAKGRFSDGGIFSSSSLGERLQSGRNLPSDAPLYDGGRPMPFVAVGDEAFPLLKHLMRPYPNRQASGNSRLEHFNYRLSRARRIVENSFGILAARWRVYRTPFEIPVDVVDIVVKATCVLHNYLSSSVFENSEVADYSTHNQMLNFQNTNSHARRANEEAFTVRNAFMEYFNSRQGRLPWLN